MQRDITGEGLSLSFCGQSSTSSKYNVAVVQGNFPMPCGKNHYKNDIQNFPALHWIIQLSFVFHFHS